MAQYTVFELLAVIRRTLTIEGFCAERAYIPFRVAFRADFHFCNLIFGGLAFVDMKSIIVLLVFLICALFSRNNPCKKLSLPRASLGDL